MNKLVVVRDDSAVGLGSTVLRVLHHLIFLQPNTISYYEMQNKLYTNSGNTWNKFFYQPFAKDKEFIMQKFNEGDYELTTSWGNGQKFFLSYGKDQKKDQFTNPGLVLPVRNTFANFIKIKENITEISKNFIENNLKNKKILSVHIRGTDMFTSHAAGQLHLIDYKKYVKPAVEKALNDQKFDNIFLATDNFDTVKNFKEDFGDLVIKRPTDLATKDNPYGLHYSNINSSDEVKYKLGVDMLVDAIIMSKCDYSLCVRSNVSILNILMRQDFNYNFIDDHIDYGRAG